MTVKLVYKTDDGKIWNTWDEADGHSAFLDESAEVLKHLNDTVRDPMFAKHYPVLLNNPSALKEMADLLLMSDVAAFTQFILTRGKTPALSVVPTSAEAAR